MSKPKLYRLSFDFKSEDAMKEFFDKFKSMSLGPVDDGTDWRDTVIMHEDYLHGHQYSIKTHVIRTDKAGNGVPLT